MIQKQLLIQFLLTISCIYAVYGNLDYSSSTDSLAKHQPRYKEENFEPLNNVAPILTATGNQIYCPGTSMKIVTNMTIVDPDDTGIDAIYIQISSGYENGQDVLTLAGNHPTIASSWNALTGKLTLTGVSGQPTYVNLVAAIKDVEYSNSAANPSGVRTFSITVGQANFLPSNGHYYQYFSNIGISWTNAKTAAEASIYYGLQGYLATITAADEAQLAGEQAAGAGWIGGSDQQVEGVWRWMTGPEAGTIFWNGGVNGSTPNFAFWNNGEPNNLGEEDYAHITAPGIGIPGSWNDLTINGEASGPYQPKGYIVEYGGMPGDPVLQISTSTTISIPSITTTLAQSRCGSGSVTLLATAANGTPKWYATATGGTPLETSSSFTTPILSATTIYYVDAFEVGCSGGTRTAVIATINAIPTISFSPLAPICTGESAVLTAVASAGTINWFVNATGGTSIGTGTSFTTPTLNQNTTYYAEATNNGCTSARVAIVVQVNEIPVIADEDKILCENSFVILNAGISNVTYLWSTGETTESIIVTAPGVYSVTVSNALNCSSLKTITVIQKTAPIIEDILVSGTTATIILTNTGDFEYSIDGINFQNSPIFTVEEGGLYTAFAREKNQCGSDDQTFIVLTVPSFFSPNNDGYNDFWFIKGMTFYSKAKVNIFDRYGKLLIQLNQQNNSWDGTLEGKKLPASDYWFVLTVPEINKEIKGHFSMIR
jgi:gliding motility-associated-like protein